MSGTGDERWRGGRGVSHEQNRQSGQQQRQQGNRDKPTSGQQGGRQNAQTQSQSQSQGRAGSTPNAWGPSDRANAGGAAPSAHIPVKGYNAQEVEQALKRDGPNATKSKPLSYKPGGKEFGAPRSGNPWGSKPNNMANGKDFFLELRKQISTFQNNNVPGG